MKNPKYNSDSHLPDQSTPAKKIKIEDPVENKMIEVKSEDMCKELHLSKAQMDLITGHIYRDLTSKEMITYLNLDWDNQVLKFYENTRRVNTISALQVREKTYTKSINSWKNYRKNLTELYKTINKNLV